MRTFHTQLGEWNFGFHVFDGKSTLVQFMLVAWCRQATTQYLSGMGGASLTNEVPGVM